jgi:uncharacterized membrane protein
MNLLMKIAEDQISRDDARRELERRRSPIKRALKTYGGKSIVGGAVGSSIGQVVGAGNPGAINLGKMVGQIGGLANAHIVNNRAKDRARHLSDDDLKSVYRSEGVQKKASLKRTLDDALGVHRRGKEAPTEHDADVELTRRTNGTRSALRQYGLKSAVGGIAGSVAGTALGGSLEAAHVGAGIGSLAGLAHGYRTRAIAKERTKHMSDRQLDHHKGY